MNKKFVSIDEALNYLQFINTDKEAFSNKEFKFTEPKNNDHRFLNKNKPTKDSPSKQLKRISDEIGSEKDGKKNLNKNRAIKRIVDTSKQILQANYKYEEPQAIQIKSYETQFNIYLKQYNRLSEQILAQQNERKQKKRELMELQQDNLQNIYVFTVEQDFRQLVEVSILKDKINKTNVQMVLDTFKLSLVLVRVNQMRIYQNTSEQSGHRDIKLHEIENVDYFTQPYIFTVLTIVKDKSLNSEYLCFRFDSLEKQHKWDRAIYCNYITRKMKHKGRYFLLEFPEKQEQKPSNEGDNIKKRDDLKNYDVQKKKVLKSLHLQKDRQKQKEGTRMGTAGMDTERDLPTIQRSNRFERFNTQKQLNLFSPSKENPNYNMQTAKNANNGDRNLFESNKENKSIAEKENDNQSHEVEPPSISRNNSMKNNGNQPQSRQNLQKKNENEKQKFKENQSSPKRQTIAPIASNAKQQSNLQKNPVPSSSHQKGDQPQEEKKSEKKEPIMNPYTRRKIELKNKHEKGIILEKVKFFFNKKKLMYLINTGLQYWDFDEDSKNKTAKKTIPFTEIKEHKIITEKSTILSIKYENKMLEVTGKPENINDIVQWIQVQKKQKNFADNEKKDLKLENIFKFF